MTSRSLFSCWHQILEFFPIAVCYGFTWANYHILVKVQVQLNPHSIHWYGGAPVPIIKNCLMFILFSLTSLKWRWILRRKIFYQRQTAPKVKSSLIMFICSPRISCVKGISGKLIQNQEMECQDSVYTFWCREYIAISRPTWEAIDSKHLNIIILGNDCTALHQNF